MAVVLWCACIGALKILKAAAYTPERGFPDPLLILWHRHEQGDLTTQEFERLRRALNESSVKEVPPLTVPRSEEASMRRTSTTM